MATGYGGTKESNLTTETDMSTSDFMRIVTSGSRKITLGNMLEASVTELESLGFLRNIGDIRNRRITNVAAATYTLLLDDDIVFVNASTNDIDITLMLASNAYDSTTNSSRVYTIKKNDVSATYVINLLPVGGALIDGETSIQLIGSNYPYFNIATDGTNWWSM